MLILCKIFITLSELLPPSFHCQISDLSLPSRVFVVWSSLVSSVPGNDSQSSAYICGNSTVSFPFFVVSSGDLYIGRKN